MIPDESVRSIRPCEGNVNNYGRCIFCFVDVSSGEYADGSFCELSLEAFDKKGRSDTATCQVHYTSDEMLELLNDKGLIRP